MRSNLEQRQYKSTSYCRLPMAALWTGCHLRSTRAETSYPYWIYIPDNCWIRISGVSGNKHLKLLIYSLSLVVTALTEAPAGARCRSLVSVCGPVLFSPLHVGLRCLVCRRVACFWRRPGGWTTDRATRPAHVFAPGLSGCAVSKKLPDGWTMVLWAMSVCPV